MIMCVLLCYPVSIHMSQLLSTGRPICSCIHFYIHVLYPLTVILQLINSTASKFVVN